MRAPILALTTLLAVGMTACRPRPVESAAPSVPTPMPASSDSVRLKTATGDLVGTMELPARTGPVSVVLILAGSGPTDRNGNTPALPGANNSLKMLAEGLAARGIASVRYDKRGVAASAGSGASEADLRFDTYIDDAAAWLKQLRADPRFATVVVAGHSEGSLIGIVAAQRGDADAVISIAGIARPANALIHDQLAAQLPPDMLASVDRGLAHLAAGRTVSLDSIPAPLAPLFRQSVQPYMISWFKRDPAKELAQLRVPVLIAQGTTDLQVPVADADSLAKVSPSARKLIVEGMNHVLKNATADRAAQMAIYSNPDLPVSPALIDGIAAFIGGVRRQP